MTSFTREELLEIEKIFDMYAGHNLMNHSVILERLQKFSKPEGLSNKVFEDMLHAYDTFRMISAKAHMMQEEAWKQEK